MCRGRVPRKKEVVRAVDKRLHHSPATPLTDAVSAPSLSLTSPEGVCTCTYTPRARTHRGTQRTHAYVDATTIARVYLRGIELRGKILYSLFHPELTSLFRRDIIVVHSRGAKLAGALAANESAERSRVGISGVTTSFPRPITHAPDGAIFERG